MSKLLKGGYILKLYKVQGIKEDYGENTSSLNLYIVASNEKDAEEEYLNRLDYEYLVEKVIEIEEIDGYKFSLYKE